MEVVDSRYFGAPQLNRTLAVSTETGATARLVDDATREHIMYLK